MLGPRRCGGRLPALPALPVAAPRPRRGPGAGAATAAAAGAAHCGGGRGYHVAIVGSGPAGFYTAKYLFKQAQAGKPPTPVRVDMFERLPTPFGLVRFGVAPDHPEVKNVINDFADVASSPDFRLLGNVEIGPRLPVAALRRHYDAVVLCTGAAGEKLLGIPGEDLRGVIGAPAFVKWYNGHPDYAALRPADPGEAAVVLGQGNVALDVARLLIREPAELRATDVDARALERIAGWQREGLRTVHVVGRRGFVQAAFTNAELRELLHLHGVLPIVDPEDLARCRNPASEQELSKSRMKKRSVAILETMAANFAERESTSKRLLWLRFLRAPAAVLPDSTGAAVAGIRLDRTELQGEPGSQVAAKCASGSGEEVQCGLVVRSVGFDLAPLEGLPLDRRRRVPHAQGRVEAPKAAEGGLYVSGWAKRGPQGIIASNIADAQETTARLLADLEARGGSTADARGNAETLDALLASCSNRVVSFEDWRSLEAEERRRGAADGRAAAKLSDVKEMLRLLGPAARPAPA